MLETMRKLANHFIFKTLLIILVLSFVIWGIGDIFKKDYTNIVATINSKHHINMAEYRDNLNSQIRKIENAYNQKIDDLTVKQISLMVLNQMIDTKLFEIEAQELGIIISNEEVLDYLKSISSFQDEQKKFDINKFKNFLTAINVRESEYTKIIKKELAIKFLVEIIEKQYIEPSLLTDYFYSYLNQERIVDLITIDSNKLFPKPIAWENQLKSFYENNSNDFSSPELRSFSYIEVGPKAFINEIKITEDQINKEFEDNYDSNSKIKLKEVYQEIKDKLYNLELEKQLYDLSEVLEDEISSGVDIEEIASKFNFTIKKVKAVDRMGLDKNGNNLVDDDNFQLLQLVYSNDDTEKLNVVMKNDANGLYVFKLDEIIPKFIKPFKEVEEKLKTAWLKAELEKIALDNAVKIKEELESGKNLDQLVINHEFKKDVKISRNSSLPGNLVENIFNLKVNQITNPVTQNSKVSFAILRSINNKKADHKSLNFIELSKKLKSNLRNITIEDYIKYLRKKHKIKIFNNLF